MRRFDPRLIIGILLVLGGLLSLFDAMGFISNAGGIFWGLIWGAAGMVFLYMLLNDRRNWWAAFPAFTFLGMSITSILPNSLEVLDGLIFFSAISLAFWWVYFADRQRWWAIIPAGTLLTLGAVSFLDNMFGNDNGGLFLIGLGITFVLVAVLPGGGRRSWAWIPGVILLVIGAITGTPYLGLADYAWPLVLILLGGFLVLRFFRNQTPE